MSTARRPTRADAAFWPLLGAIFLGAIDQTVVAATLPAIVADLDLPLNRLDDVSWTITAYLAGYALVLPLAGSIADRIERVNRLILVSLGIFALGSILVGVGQTLPVIVLGRFTQSVGAGALVPVALGRISSAASFPTLVRRIGWVTAIAEGGALLGPVYGAGALHIMSWRWIFLLNVPVAIAFAWVLHRTWLPDARRGTAAIDWRGGLLLGAILSCTILAASQEASRLDERVGRPALLAAAILGCAAYALSARRTPEPVLPATLVGGRLMQAVLLTHLLSGMALIAPLILVPLWGNTLMSLEPTQAALLLARLSLTIPIGALLGSRLSGMLPLTIVATAGMLLAGGALELMSAWPVSIDTTTMTGPLLLGGFGFGLMISPTNGLAIQSAGQVHASTAASLVQAARLVGMAVGSAALASFGLDHFNTLVAELTLSDPTAYVEAVRSSAQQVFTRLFHWGALAAVAGSGAALLTWSGKHEPVQPR